VRAGRNSERARRARAALESDSPRSALRPKRRALAAASWRLTRRVTKRRGAVPTVVIVTTCVLSAWATQTGSVGVALTAATRTVTTRATRSFLDARRARAHEIKASLRSGQQAVEHYVAKTDARCRGVASTVPRSAQLAELNNDALVSVGVTLIRAHAGGLTRFARTAKRLTWGRDSLTMLVWRLAAYERDLARVGPLDICAVFAAWAESSYRVVPIAASRFQREMSEFSSDAVTGCRPTPPNGQRVCSVRREGSTVQPRKVLGPRATLSVIWRSLMRYESRKLGEVAHETEDLEGSLAAGARRTLSSAAGELTRNLDLEPLALRLFITSLGQD
jgi:hypothetical protein